jgi:hypothetical protein
MTKNSILTAAFFVLLATIMQSCNFLPTSINDTWHVSKMQLAANDTESESVYTDAFLSFYGDDAAVFFNKNKHDSEMRPIYRTGKWKKDGDELKLKLQRTMIDVAFRIVELSEGWLVLEIVDGPKETIGTQLKCQRSDLYKNNTFDLLHPENNLWRAKPEHKENTVEIQKRVASHLKFLVDYFYMVDKKSQSYFEPAALQTPFRFYSNGIALASEFETDNMWLSNFYDEDDALKGARILNQAISSMNEYPADEKSFVKSYYNALVMMLEYVEK